MAYKTITVPADGAKISMQNGRLSVPDNPILPFIEGDGTGPDIWRASVRVMDAAVAKCYGGARKIHWMKVYAGEEAFRKFNDWLPQGTDRCPLAHRRIQLPISLQQLENPFPRNHPPHK